MNKRALLHIASLRLCTAYHQILLQGFGRLHNMSPDSLKRKFEESNELVTTADVVLDPVESGGKTSLFQKSLRIKAYKAYCWLNNSETVYDLLVAVARVLPLESVMWTFMAWQEKGAHLSLEESPLIQMTNSTTSPAQIAVSDLCKILATGDICEGSDGVKVSLQELAQRSQRLIAPFFILFWNLRKSRL